MILRAQSVRCAFLLILSAAPTLRADPIIPTTGILRLTSGQMNFGLSDTFHGPVSAAGEGFTLGGYLDEFSTFHLPPRDTFDPSHTLQGRVWGTLRIGEAELNLDDFPLSMQITAPVQMVPPQGEDSDFVKVTYPFQLSGLLAGVSDGTTYHYELLGLGHGRILLLPHGLAWHSSYTFEPQAVIPEPGTILMVGTGAVTWAVRRQRRRRTCDNLR